MDTFSRRVLALITYIALGVGLTVYATIDGSLNASELSTVFGGIVLFQVIIVLEAYSAWKKETKLRDRRQRV